MLMDVSSEMIHALLPIYLVSVLGASMVTVRIIEGIAEATASITKIFSGALSDRLGQAQMARGRRLRSRGFHQAGISAGVRRSPGWWRRVSSTRIGKGIRGAPVTRWWADLSPADLRGASFGLRQSLDTVGAFMGPLLAIALMWWTADNFTAVFWFAVIPAFPALALIVLRRARAGPAGRAARRAQSDQPG